ncbi:MAG TPA: glycosyltransferase [Spirochaetota bacterium]|nr:glycosyltransferase [Spirochaetota bacterium]
MTKKILIMIVSDNNLEAVKKAIIQIDNVDNTDLLIVDDGSTYDILKIISKYPKVKCIKHEFKLGYGSCVDAALDYSRDLEYDYLLILECDAKNITNDVNEIIKNLDYGYDIVSCSRILENFDYGNLDPDLIKFYEEIAASFKDETDSDFTDPLSGNKGFNVQAMEHVLLTELTHGVFFQVLIQGLFYGCSVIEIPSDAGLQLGNELTENENPLNHFIAVLTTEKFLFNKGAIN